MSDTGLRATVVSLWLRLASLGIVAFVYAEALLLAPKKVQGWTYYLTGPEVVFEVAVRLVSAALVGMLVASLCTALLVPLLWILRGSRQRMAATVIPVAVALIVFVDSRFTVETLVKWYGRHLRFLPALLIAHAAVFLVALVIPKARRELLASLDVFLTGKAARRAAIGTVAAAVILVLVQFSLSRTAQPVKASAVAQRPKSSFLLITFDALNAEDMSLYGYKLPTTPNIDAFCGKATVFTNFYSVSTFTTPSVTGMLTGRYPSETYVYQLQGRVRPRGAASNTLPSVMRAAGYSTGAFVSNPFAYFLTADLNDAFEYLPEPVFNPHGLHSLWNATWLLHQDSGIGSRIDEYFDLENVWNRIERAPEYPSMRFRPAAAFDNAEQLINRMPDGFFVWIHVITPHNPYLPDPQDRGRFLPPGKAHTFEELGGPRWQPHYESDQQSQVDQRRLRYDEFVTTADRAFGAFMKHMDDSGKLENTTVIFSADHGESFEGGVYRHSSPYLTRPIIHIPLIIRTPGQQEGRRIDFVADQTALAPTILELAGVAKPEWMVNRSLADRLTGKKPAEEQGVAFTQYLETNSVFKPLRHGTVGVIDSQYEYVLDLATVKGGLRPLQEAHIWNLDRSADDPARASAMRAAIYSRFPGLAQKAK